MKNRTAPLVNVGTPVESVEALQKAIIAILMADADEPTKRVALRVLSKGVRTNAAFTNCNITDGHHE